MLSLTNYLTESKLGYAIAGLTGLGGAYTGGGLSGYYDKKKESAALKAIALAKRNPLDYQEGDRTGGSIIYSLLGSIPGVGSITNIMAYKDRLKAEEALHKLHVQHDKK